LLLEKRYPVAGATRIEPCHYSSIRPPTEIDLVKQYSSTNALGVMNLPKTEPCIELLRRDSAHPIHLKVRKVGHNFVRRYGAMFEFALCLRHIYKT
jgi:hypothetical protein